MITDLDSITEKNNKKEVIKSLANTLADISDLSSVGQEAGALVDSIPVVPCNIDTSNVEKESSPQYLNPDKNAIKKVMMTRTEILRYPDGREFLTSRSWWEGQPMVFKKKEKKIIESKPVETSQAEEY